MPTMHVATSVALAFTAMATNCGATAAANIVWHEAQEYGPAMLHGKAAYSTGEQTSAYYSRLPSSAEQQTRPSIWSLSNQPAGTFLQFATNSSTIILNYTLGSSALSMWHFPSTGVSGADLYCYDEGNSSWRWVATTDPAYPVTSTVLVPADAHTSTGETRRYRLHLPTYNEVKDDLVLGIDEDSVLVPDNSTLIGFGDNEAIVWYGSSILQGGVASRPGQIATHQVTRRLGRLIYNFGFSGNCWMETSVAQYLVNITPAPALFIIDCNPNMIGFPAAGSVPDIYSRTVPLVDYIRSHGHATTPIILSEGTTYGTEWLSTVARAGQVNKSAALHEAFVNLTSGSTPDQHLYYAEGPGIFSDGLNMTEVASDLVDPTVGGTHPTDTGMMKQAVYWSAKIKEVLTEDQAKIGQRSTAKTLRDRPASDQDASSLDWSDADVSLAHGYKTSTEIALEGVATAEMTTTASLDLSDVLWFDAAPLLQGRAEFTDPALPRASPYDRLPVDANGTVTSDVWTLSEDSTGMFLRITTNGSAFALNHTLRFKSSDLWHMPQTGTDGLDIYAWDAAANSSTGSGAWRHLPSMSVEEYSSTTVVSTVEAIAPVTPLASPAYETYLVYLPLRNAPSALSVGFLDENWCYDSASCKAKGIVDPAPDFRASPPVVWYGTSIQQGGVASRAGTEYDAIISRALSREIINFGFAGNGHMDLSVAKYLADIPAPVAAFVIDCLPNMNADTVAAKTQPLVQYLRSANDGRHAETPIILAEGTPYPVEWFSGPADASKNAALRAAYDALVEAGDKHLHYVESADLFGALGPLINPTVGGVHSSDLGQYAIADYYVRNLPSILQ